MKERPILFKAEMVRAILDGRKTMTRRAVKVHFDSVKQGEGTFVVEEKGQDGTDYIFGIKCPYGKIGDRLWVRETFCNDQGTVLYRADLSDNGILKHAVKWKPSIFMPRSASRINLEITNIRIERLQDITERDAQKEGVFPCVITNGEENYTIPFIMIWEQINGKTTYSFNKNPWVWVIEFKRIKSQKMGGYYDTAI